MYAELVEGSKRTKNLKCSEEIVRLNQNFCSQLAILEGVFRGFAKLKKTGK